MIYFSIILPVYNVDKYVETCLKSILDQEYRNFELIIVNDGSTDSTLHICKKISQQDYRVVIINKQNEGVSIARNRGLDIAKGLYVLFVDGDDVLYPKALEILHDKLQMNLLDYIRYEYKTIDEYGRDLYPNYEARKRAKFSGKIISSSECVESLVRNEFFLWSGAFKRDLIEKMQIRFLEGCTYNEDTLFMCRFFLCVTSCSYIPTVFYGYRKTNECVTSRFNDKNFSDILHVVDLLIQLNNKASIKWLRKTIEVLTLRLLESKSFKVLNIKKNLSYCLLKPVTIEWKMMKLLGIKRFSKIYSSLFFLHKIKRRLL